MLQITYGLELSHNRMKEFYFNKETLALHLENKTLKSAYSLKT